MAESSEDIRKEHIRDLGGELGAVYHALWREVVWLHAKWIGTANFTPRHRSTFPLLKKVANDFFGVLRNALSEDVVLHAARLTDPSETGRGRRAQDNLTRRRLPALVDHALLRDEPQVRVNAAAKACETLKALRDKWIAHRDLNLALETSSSPLPGIAFEELESALEAIRAVMNRLEVHYSLPEVGYQYVSSIGSDADSLIYYLRKGVGAEKRQMERLRAGKPLPEDLEPEDEGGNE